MGGGRPVIRNELIKVTVKRFENCRAAGEAEVTGGMIKNWMS